MDPKLRSKLWTQQPNGLFVPTERGNGLQPADPLVELGGTPGTVPPIKSPSDDPRTHDLANGESAEQLVEAAYDHVFGKPGSAYREAMDRKLTAMAESYVLFGSVDPELVRELLSEVGLWSEKPKDG